MIHYDIVLCSITIYSSTQIKHQKNQTHEIHTHNWNCFIVAHH